jgi:acetyl esterase/lipase
MMLSFRRVLVACSTMVLAAGTLCLGVAPRSDAAAPSHRYAEPVFASTQVTRDVLYGQAVNNRNVLQALKLDLYQPAGDTAAQRPAVVFAHGGAFKGGDKGDRAWVLIADDLARRGWVVAVINYRLDGSSDEATDDLQTAVRWFKANARTYRVDPNHVAVMGSSSGAQMALEASFDADDAASRVAGGVAVSWQVQSGIDAGDPPIAVFEALDDPASPFLLAEAMCAQTTALGNVCEMYMYPTGGHGKDLLAAHRSEILDQASGFLCRQVLGPNVCTPG